MDEIGQRISKIINTYDTPDLMTNQDDKDGGTDPLWAILKRAATNQADAGNATFSYYAMWTNTVRDDIIEGIRGIDGQEPEAARKRLVRAANSLAAFAEIQKLMDPLGLK